MISVSDPVLQAPKVTSGRSVRMVTSTAEEKAIQPFASVTSTKRPAVLVELISTVRVEPVSAASKFQR